MINKLTKIISRNIVMEKIVVIIFFILYPTLAHSHGLVEILGVEHEEGFIDLKIYINKKIFLDE